MTIIEQKGGNFWIESIVVPRAAISGGVTDTEITLERPGVFLGCSLALDTAETQGPMAQILFSLQQGGSDNTLTLGLNISSVRLRRSNLSGTDTYGVYILIYMRKNGPPS